MKEYLVPTGDGEAQFIERRSRFIGHIFLTETEEEALARLKQMREQYWDATHNVYAYIIRDGATRFSDDGEPGGTAGMPVLQVLQREELYNVTCVVTRYFGGILLGAGGLVRAYTKAAQQAVADAGVARMTACDLAMCAVAYNKKAQMEALIAQHGGGVDELEFGADLLYTYYTPAACTDGFEAALTELTLGQAQPIRVERQYRALPVPFRFEKF